MKLIHLSDLHVIDLDGAVPRRLLNKRFTGYVNLRLRRAHQHSAAVARRVLQEVARRKPDHVAVTGDLTYLALEREFEGARQMLREALGLPPEQVSVVPGNHDLYTRGSARTGRCEAYLGEYATSDLPNVSSPRADWTYPYVRLRGSTAIVGLTTAVPRPPLVASGALGADQRAALERILAHPEVRRRMPVILQHHPPIPPRRPLDTWLGGLTDWRRQRAILAALSRGLVLHGHLHRPLRHTIAGHAGRMEVLGATSASLADEPPAEVAGFNEVELSDGDGSVEAVMAVRFTPALGEFRESPLTEAAALR